MQKFLNIKILAVVLGAATVVIGLTAQHDYRKLAVEAQLAEAEYKKLALCIQDKTLPWCKGE